MQAAPAWDIGKDNTLRVNPYEMRRLKTKRHPTERTLHVECPNYPEMDQRSAHIVAKLALSDAAIGGCSIINVKGPRWNYEFRVDDLNGRIKKQWSKHRVGMFQNPVEKQIAGCFYDTTRKLWAVPQRYSVKETIKFPAR